MEDPAARKGDASKPGFRITYRIRYANGFLFHDIVERLEAGLEATRPRPLAGRVVVLANQRGVLAITLDDPDDLQELDTAFFSEYRKWVAEIDCPDTHDSRSRCLRLTPEYLGSLEERAFAQAISAVRERIDARGVVGSTVMRAGNRLVVELPGLDEAEMRRVKDLIERSATLEFKMVLHDSPYMRTLAAHVGSDPAAKAAGIEVEFERWHGAGSGKQFDDYYLIARDRREILPLAEAKKRGCDELGPNATGKVECVRTGQSILRDYLAVLASEDPDLAVDAAHEIGFEHVPATPGAERPDHWRTYYLAKTAELDGSAVASADVVWNPDTNQSEVMVRFTRRGGRIFGETTARNVGHKMAILLDGQVDSAPIIQGAIRGGRATIAMGVTDPWGRQRAAEELVTVLGTGALPAPLVEESTERLGALRRDGQAPAARSRRSH